MFLLHRTVHGRDGGGGLNLPLPGVGSAEHLHQLGWFPTSKFPINTNFSESCDYARDSCMHAMDGECNEGDSIFKVCDPNTDCLDCDPCQQKRYDGCDACVAAGCYWCPLDSLCLSGNPFATEGIGNSANLFRPYAAARRISPKHAQPGCRTKSFRIPYSKDTIINFPFHRRNVNCRRWI
jgi:hypothetical protein